MTNNGMGTVGDWRQWTLVAPDDVSQWKQQKLWWANLAYRALVQYNKDKGEIDCCAVCDIAKQRLGHK